MSGTAPCTERWRIAGSCAWRRATTACLALLSSRGDRHWRAPDAYKRKRMSVLRSKLYIRCSLLPGGLLVDSPSLLWGTDPPPGSLLYILFSQHAIQPGPRKIKNSRGLGFHRVPCFFCMWPWASILASQDSGEIETRLCEQGTQHEVLHSIPKDHSRSPDAPQMNLHRLISQLYVKREIFHNSTSGYLLLIFQT